MTDIPKDLSQPIADSYNPEQVEKGWMPWWKENKFFVADPQKALEKGPENCFIMVIPPPNVTGSLHLGHSLTVAIEDLIVRWHRMNGKETVWVPGLDHAGIATQSVVEKKLMRLYGKKRLDYTRDDFLKHIWEWKEESGGNIVRQCELLGISTDHTRQRFTMDDQCAKAVKEAFIRLHGMGHIYRMNRLVSWCSHLQTALSDIEVDTLEITKPDRIRVPGYDKTVEVGKLWHFKYPVKHVDRFLEVATTRIETMLGDTAVAVHPEDPRYADLIGKELEHPFVPDRKLTVIADTHVSMEFGTGAVKITPAHDKNDFEIGVRHNLDMINVFTNDGRICEGYGQFSGQHRFQCREEIVKALDDLGLLGEIEPNTNAMSIPMCSRSGDVIEYRLIPQWYFNCSEGAKASMEALENGDLRILPEVHHQTWRHWLGNIQEWCISRQLWWGHRIPAYIATNLGEAAKEQWVVAENAKEAEQKLRELHNLAADAELDVQQDEDVLDTWFSSGLFPFSVFGWPDINTDEFKAFFPGSLLETGHDILFFWVARMTMMSYYLCDKQMPFKDVFLHAMVRDAHGKKMSKSLGNVLDPLDCIQGVTLDTLQEKLKSNTSIAPKELTRALDAQKKDFPKGIPECGADGLRMGLVAYLKQGRSVNLDVNRVLGYRQFCNKLWNAVKFAINYFDGECAQFELKPIANVTKDMSVFDKHILQRLKEVSDTCNSAIEAYQFADYVSAVYSFFIYDFCDVYVEVLKPVFRSGTEEAQDAARQALYRILDTSLRLLHPIIPFVTEELYHRLPGPSSLRSTTITKAAYPTASEFEFPFAEENFEDVVALFMTVVRAIRSSQATLELANKQVKVVVKSMNDREKDQIATLADSIAFLAKTVPFGDEGSFLIGGDDEIPAMAAMNAVNATLEVGIICPPETDFKKIRDRLTKRLTVLEKSFGSLEKKMSLPNYVDKVPENVREADQVKHESLIGDIAALKASIVKLPGC